MLLNPRCLPRRLALTIISRHANRRFAFAFAALAVLSAKVVHILAHVDALSTNQIGLWMYSFFAQDVAALILIRLLLDHCITSFSSIALRVAVSFLGSALLAYNLILCLVATTFYLVAGSEIRWRNVAVASDPSSRALVLTGTVTFAIVIVVGAALSWLLQDVCYALFGFYANVVSACCSFVSRLLGRIVPCCRSRSYTKLPRQDVENNHKLSFDYSDSGSESEDSVSSGTGSELLAQTPIFFRFLSRWLAKMHISVSDAILFFSFNFIMHFLAAASIIVFIGFTLARPNDGSLTFVSWTTGLLPFIDFTTLSPTLGSLRSIYGVGVQHEWDHLSALTQPITLPWLPKDEVAGFEDWYRNMPHYNASADPMKIDNLETPLLPELNNTLKDLDIRHVVVFFMESARNDVFPIKNNSLIWNRLAETWPEKTLPKNVQEKIANLTPIANFVTGDYDDGFEHKAPHKKRGGAHFTKYHTAGTYTLKSLPATLCGMPPLIADFNLDWKHHFYQPCLPHIFEALNNVPASESHTDPSPYRNSTWQSYFYQTATLQFNEFDKLMTKIGFPEENTIDVEYLRSNKAKHGRVTNPNTNYFGFEEEPLLDYIRDAFESAAKKDERVFLTHITSTTHHPFVLPSNTKYTPLANGLDEFSHYINTQGYNDQWVRKFLNLLDEQGVSNQTLVVFVGDHGTSLAENNIASSYYNPNVGNDHVPLVISHPQLPAFNINSAVSGIQVLPTILDFLLETGSLNKASRDLLKRLVHNYEGQSLIRPQKLVNDKTGQGNWQFTTVNPGRALLTARDARYPERRLVIPVINNVEWRYSNITEDPREEHSIQAFEFKAFLKNVEQKHGIEVAKWAEEGAFVSRFFVEENAKRWQYGLYAP